MRHEQDFLDIRAKSEAEEEVEAEVEAEVAVEGVEAAEVVEGAYYFLFQIRD